MADPLQLSVVIVNWNVRELLRDCLNCLQRQTLPPDAFEVIVADNASRDDSVTMIRADFPEVRLIANDENLGFAGGCEQGYRIARGRYILLLNPDTAPPPNALRQMLSDFEAHPEAGILGSRLLNTDGTFQRSAGGAFPSLANLTWNYLFLNRLMPKLAPPSVFMHEDRGGVTDQDWVSGAALLFRREAVGETIFDPHYFMFGEDMDLCARVRDGGWRVLYSANQSIIHHHGKSFAHQSSLEVLANVYRGPRRFFRARHGLISTQAYDLILLIGYAIRWPLFKLLDLVKPRAGYDELARFSRQYLGIMLRTMWSP
jgi:GT2 family glycosyltransferase